MLSSSDTKQQHCDSVSYFWCVIIKETEKEPPQLFLQKFFHRMEYSKEPEVGSLKVLWLV